MAAPDITLVNGQVLVTESGSTSGIVAIDPTIMFGTIEKVSDLTNTAIVGTSVMFNPQNGRQFMYGSTIYYLITEDNISGVEPPPV